MIDTQKVANPNHDFNTPIEKTSVDIAKFILAKLEESKDFIIVENVETLEPIARAAFYEKSTDFSIEIMKFMSTTDIPADYTDKGIDKIILVLESLKAFIKGSVNQNKDELMSRFMEVRSPRTGKFAAECVSLGALLLKLEETRQSQGNNKYDYFSDPAVENADTENKDVAPLPEGEEKPKEE